MATILHRGFGRLASPGNTRHFGPALAVILAALAFGAATLVHSAFGSLVTSGSGTSQPATLVATSTRPPPAEPQPVLERVDRRNIEALSDAAAKKYRISIEAMRELVDAAYVEARRNRLDPLLIVAVMAVESRFNPIAQSNFGATGLMQVIPHYHKDKFSAARGESVLDPHTNIKVGAKVLKEYIARGGNEAAGLQLYNGASHDPSRAYATKVMTERGKLRDALRSVRARGNARTIA